MIHTALMSLAAAAHPPDLVHQTRVAFMRLRRRPARLPADEVARCIYIKRETRADRMTPQSLAEPKALMGNLADFSVA